MQSGAFGMYVVENVVEGSGLNIFVLSGLDEGRDWQRITIC